VKRKIIWLVVSCVMVAALILASCAPAAPPEEVKPVVPEKKEEVTPVKKEGPQYGGTYTWFTEVDPLHFDERYQGLWYCNAIQLTNESLLEGDWAKGLMGSAVTDFHFNMFPWPKFMTGYIAEDWEIADDQTMNFTIRQGINFQDKPPANGREVDAYDVEHSLLRLYEYSTSYQYTAYDWERHLVSIEATDK